MNAPKPRPAIEKSFEHWKEDVNRAVEILSCGLSADDLPDVCYRDWYDDDVSAVSAARRAIRNAQE